MRALILLECLVVLLLAGLILTRKAPGASAGDVDTFGASRMLLDAKPGEKVVYRIDEALGTLQYDVVTSDPGGPQGPPRFSIQRTFKDGEGVVAADIEPNYIHILPKHGLFPFMTPEQPAAWDRVWILKRIRRDTITWQGAPLRCWHIDCIDPGLPPDRDSVEVWMHEDVPVYGILRWQRAGHKYECTSWRPKS